MGAPMKISTKILGFVALLTLLMPVLPAFAATSQTPPPSAPPCSVTITGENVGNTAIQTAISNAEAHVTGPVVCIGPGIFPEQLVITSSGISLRGLGTFHNPTVIEPNAPIVSTSVSPDSGLNEYNIILVEGVSSSVTGVTLSNLVVDGTNAQSTFTSCNEDYEGVLYLNGGGTISNDTVQNILLPSADAGCQPGDAILVQTASGYSSTVTISGDKALNYNKNGITCNDMGTTCTIKSNKVSFYTPYSPYIAPNGIQVAYGAVATVTKNTVEGNTCTEAIACGPDVITQYAGSGILTYGSGAGTAVSSNILSGNDIGVLVADDSAPQTGNTITGSTIAGILQDDGASTYTASKNILSGNPIGIMILSDGCSGYPNTFTANIKSNTYGLDSPKIQVLTMHGIPEFGCTNAGSVTLHFGGSTYSISGNNTVVSIT